MKKYLSLALIFALCLSMLSGCNFLSPKDASSLIERSNKAMESINNYSMTMELDIETSLNGGIEEGLSMSVLLPIEVNMCYDYAGSHVHGEMNMSSSMKATVSYGGEGKSTSEDFSQSAETYMVISDDDVVTYTNTDGAGWVESKTDFEDLIFDVTKFTSSSKSGDVFKNASMEKSGDEYIVTLGFADVLENNAFNRILKDSIPSDGGFNLDWDSFVDFVEDTEIVYVFDTKTYFLKSVVVEEFKIDDVSLMDGIEGMDLSSLNIDDFYIAISMSITFDDFGEIDEDDVKVPKKVVKSAVHDGPVPPYETPDETLPYVEPETEPYVNPETEPDKEPETEPQGGTVSDEYVFFYNGELLGIPTDYHVFLDDGWYPVDDGEFTFFLCMDHDEYEGALLYLMTNDGSGSEKYVKEYGSDGFSIDLAHCENKPNISFAGIECGDNYSKVLSVLGEPEDLYSSFDYKSASWEIKYDGKDCTLSITLLNDEVVSFEIYYLG